MQHELLIALLTGLGGMLGWGVADFFAKKTIDEIGDVTTLFWGQLIGIFPLLLIFISHPQIPNKIYGSGFFYLILLGVWSGLSYIPTYVAFGKGKVSLLSPIFASNAVIVAILSALFFHEIIPVSRQVSFAVVFLGILFINADIKSVWQIVTGKKKEKFSEVKGIKEILLAVVLYSFWLIALNSFIKDEYWVPLLLVIRIFSALSLFIYANLKKINLKVSNFKLWKFLILIGVFDVAAFASVSYGFSQTSYVSVVAMLSGVFSLPTIILARIFLKEQTTTTQTIGSVIVIIGIILLTLL